MGKITEIIVAYISGQTKNRLKIENIWDYIGN